MHAVELFGDKGIAGSLHKLVESSFLTRNHVDGRFDNKVFCVHKNRANETMAFLYNRDYFYTISTLFGIVDEKRRARCRYCYKELCHARKCSVCLAVHYCDKNCQHNDWSCHRTECCASFSLKEFYQQYNLMTPRSMPMFRGLIFCNDWDENRTQQCMTEIAHYLKKRPVLYVCDPLAETIFIDNTIETLPEIVGMLPLFQA